MAEPSGSASLHQKEAHLIHMKLNYELEDAGWAYVTMEDIGKKLTIDVSYLHDSLKQLIEAIIHLIEGFSEQVVIFMAEPGEHQLILKMNNGIGLYELRWFDDWASWDMYPSDKFEVVLRGEFSLQKLSANILSVVEAIYIKYGMLGYKENWVEHDFPYDLYMKLKRMA